MFDTKNLPSLPDVIAPDGSDVRILLSLKGGSMAHFELAVGRVSRAIQHRTVDEIWYIVEGEGEMWRKLEDREEVTQIQKNVCITIPVGTKFQFRALGATPLKAIAITMPPWPGDGEAVFVEGKWQSSF